MNWIKSVEAENNRVTKQDMIIYLENRSNNTAKITDSKSAAQDNKTQTVKEIKDKPQLHQFITLGK